MKKTKTKSKQKKVLVVSVLLAALIVAGGTFAWFTSKDEVTNKLSASNDYGVTITETFTPPEQWLPGEDVKKEVGVVNTGNIDAFVKLSLANALDLTVMGEATATAPTVTTADAYVELKAAAVKSLQAGGELVYKAGDTISDADKAAGTEFEPTADGLYIFRRNVTQGKPDTYEYAGYYRLGEKYYAVEPTSANAANYPQKKTDSNLEPKFDYTEVTATNPRVKATYDAGTADDASDDIVIYINLDMTDWTCIDGVFYYNKILASGDASRNLVTSVVLADDVQADAYVDFDYYLTVTSDSVQVTSDDAKTTAVAAEWTEVTAALNGNDVTWTEK